MRLSGRAQQTGGPRDVVVRWWRAQAARSLDIAALPADRDLLPALVNLTDLAIACRDGARLEIIYRRGWMLWAAHARACALLDGGSAAGARRAERLLDRTLASARALGLPALADAVNALAAARSRPPSVGVRQ